MKKIKIKFLDFWGKFDENNNFIINTLKKKYEVEISDQPDYLFFSGFNAEIYNYDCIRIFFTYENFIPDFNLCDYAIGFEYIDFGDRYIRYPLYLVSDFSYYKNDSYNKDMKLALEKHLITENEIKDKQGFCSFVVSSPVDNVRNKFCEMVSNYKKVASGGKYRNNVGGPVDDKLEFQSKYKFAIAFENSSSPGYTTEKLMQAFAAKTVPIYYGSQRIKEEFNSKAFINCNDFNTFEEVIEKIIEIDNDDDKFKNMLREPAFISGFDYNSEKRKLEEFLYNIIEQDKIEARRRNCSHHGSRYENKYKRTNKVYLKLIKIKVLFDTLLNKIK